MKTNCSTFILALALSACSLFPAYGQKTEGKTETENKSESLSSRQAPKHLFLFEIDPLPYLLGGAGGHFGWTPKNNKHFAFGIGFIAGPELPDALHNMSAKNKDQGWQLKVNQGAALWTHYYFQSPHKGWFTGLQLITQELELSNKHFPNQKDRTNTLMLAISTGYVWYPIRDVNLYLRPWAGFGFQKTIKTTFEPEKVTPEMRIGDREYDLPAILPFATFHVGYNFR